MNSGSDGLNIGEIRVDEGTGAATLLLKKELDDGKRWSLALTPQYEVTAEPSHFGGTHAIVTQYTKKNSFKLQTMID
jgi:hypothetical protein